MSKQYFEKAFSTLALKVRPSFRWVIRKDVPVAKLSYYVMKEIAEDTAKLSEKTIYKTGPILMILQ